ncbi:MAG: hypothetical protein ACE5J4_02675 [Candidatus Aenigmatarchaeota archaeon]
MKFKIIKEKKNPLLKRKELLISLDYNGATVSKAELQKILAEHFKVNMENLEVSKILSEVGLPKGKAWIKIWEEKKVPIYSEIKKEKKRKVEKEPEERKPKKEEEMIKEKPSKPEKKEEQPEVKKEPEKEKEGEEVGKKEESKGKEREEAKEQEQA